MAAPQTSSSSTLIPGVHQNMAMRIGRTAAELSRPCFTAGSSRVARSRATKALGMRKRKTVGPQSPPSPNQESAVNPRTGKVALGPWLGPYETHNDAAPTEPLFLDYNGNTYASLSNVASAVAGRPASPKSAPAPATGLSQPPLQGLGVDKAPAAAARQQLYAMVSRVAQRQALAAQAQKPSQWPGRGRPNGSGRCGNIMARAINQPRRS